MAPLMEPGHDGHVFLSRSGEDWYFLGYFYGQEREMGAPQGALHGENLAIQWATLWLLKYLIAVEWVGDVTFLWDAQVPGRRAQGLYSLHDDPYARRTRRLQHALEAYLGNQRVHHSHVSAHTGVWPNEFVDAAAKQALQDPCILTPEQELASLNHIDPEDLAWLWLHVQSHRTSLPYYKDGNLQWDQTTSFEGLDAMELINSAIMPNRGAADTQENGVETMHFELCLGTYNCLSLGPRDERLADDHKPGLQGQIPLLRKIAHEKGFHLLGLQECRTPQGTFRSSTHLRLCSGATDQGCYGVELWVDLMLPYAWKANGKPVFFKPQDFAIVCADPRLMIVRHSAPELTLFLVIGHAPHTGHDQELTRKWWNDLKQHFPAETSVDSIHFLDANGRIAGEETEHFGNLSEDPPNRDSDLLREHAATHGLFAPSTFRQWHEGQLYTWTHPNGKSRARLDFVLLPLSWKRSNISSWVETDFHAPRAFQDHQCAAIWLSWQALQRSRARGNKPFDREAMNTPEGKEKLTQIWIEAPMHEWHINATTHALHLTTYLQQSLELHFPRRKKMRHWTSASEETLQGFHQLTWSKRDLRTYKAMLKQLHLRYWMDVWQGKTWNSENFRWAAKLFRSFAVLTRMMPLQAKALNKAVRAERRAYAANIADHAEGVPPHELYRALRPILPNRKTPQVHRPLPHLEKSDGTMTTSIEEIDQRWTEHFSVLEGGEECDPQRFVWEALSTQHNACKPAAWAFEDLPHLDMLERAIHQMRIGRAPGPDRLPAELFKADPGLVAKRLYPILMKFACRLEEPLQHKGGSLIALYKGKGKHQSCHSFRSILLLSNMGKLLRSSMRRMVNGPYENSTDHLQLAGKRYQQVLFGAQCVRHYLQHCKDSGKSAGIIFADIASAFYTVVRQIALGASTSDLDVALVVKRLGLGPETMPALHEALKGDTCYAALGATPACQAYLRQSLDHTWFDVRSKHFVATHKGSRPGDSWADIVFNILFSSILKEVKKELQAQGILLEVPALNEPTIWPTETVHGELLPIWQTTWADDLALLLQFTTPAMATRDLAHASSALLRALRRYGMKATIGHGKTEALVMLRGPGSMAARRSLFSTANPTIPILEEDGVIFLPITTKYRHLGGILSSQQTMMATKSNQQSQECLLEIRKRGLQKSPPGLEN